MWIYEFFLVVDAGSVEYLKAVGDNNEHMHVKMEWRQLFGAAVHKVKKEIILLHFNKMCSTQYTRDKDHTVELVF